MKLISRKLPDNHNIFLFGDAHLGSATSSVTGWQCLVDMLHSKYDGCANNYGMEGGDMLEAILIDDKRYSPDKLKEKFTLNLIDDAIEMRKPIAKKMLSMLQGNHEYSLWKIGDIAEQIASKLGVEYGTYTCKLTVRDSHGHTMYKIFDEHGRRSISSIADDPLRRKTNLELTLKRQLKFKAADCAVMIKHHVHKLLVCKPNPELYLKDDGEYIRQGHTHWGQTEEYIHPDARWYGCAGSFMRLYEIGMSGYGERFDYDPVELGFLVLKVRDRKIVGLEPVRLDI